MIIQCNNCWSKLQLKDDLVISSKVKCTKCKNCGNWILINNKDEQFDNNIESLKTTTDQLYTILSNLKESNPIYFKRFMRSLNYLTGDTKISDLNIESTKIKSSWDKRFRDKRYLIIFFLKDIKGLYYPVLINSDGIVEGIKNKMLTFDQKQFYLNPINKVFDILPNLRYKNIIRFSVPFIDMQISKDGIEDDMDNAFIVLLD